MRMLLAISGAVAAAYLYQYLLRRVTRAWRTNAAFLEGTFSRWWPVARGSCEGIPVVMYAGWQFILALSYPAGGEGWSMVYEWNHRGPPRWRLVAGSRELAARMEALGALEAMEGWSEEMRIDYRCRDGRLRLRLPAPDMFYCPAGDDLRDQVDLLRYLRRLHEHAAAFRAAM